MDGRPIYIEERRPSTSSAARGGSNAHFFLPQFTLSNVMRVLPVSPKALKVLIASCYFHCLSDHVGLTCVQ